MAKEKPERDESLRDLGDQSQPSGASDRGAPPYVPPTKEDYGPAAFMLSTGGSPLLKSRGTPFAKETGSRLDTLLTRILASKSYQKDLADHLEQHSLTLSVLAAGMGEIPGEDDFHTAGINEYEFDEALESVARPQFYHSLPDANANGEHRVSFSGFDLVFKSCDSEPVEIQQTGHLVFETLKSRIDEVDKARQVIDSERDKWLHEQAEPLLDELAELLKNASFPESVRDDIRSLREDVRRNAYYPGIIETSDVAAALERDQSWIREMAREGRLGLKLSRHFIHSESEVAHFFPKPREVGAPKKKPD